jgi:hypothetical protein
MESVLPGSASAIAEMGCYSKWLGHLTIRITAHLMLGSVATAGFHPHYASHAPAHVNPVGRNEHQNNTCSIVKVSGLFA